MVPEPLLVETKPAERSTLTEFDIALHGESYHVKVAGFGTPERGKQSCFLWVDGIPEEVVVHREEFERTEVKDLEKRPLGPGDIRVAIPGTIMGVQVKVGDKVKVGQTLLILESMKMETEVHAPHDGTVTAVLCQKGDKVTPDQVMIRIE